MEYQETLRIAQEEGGITAEQREGFLAAAREFLQNDDLDAFFAALEVIGLSDNAEKSAKNLLEGE